MKPIGRVFVDQFTGKCTALVKNDVEGIKDMSLIYIDDKVDQSGAECPSFPANPNHSDHVVRLLSAASQVERCFGDVFLADRIKAAAMFFSSATPANMPASNAANYSAVEWLRNNYQDYPNIADLCDAMQAAVNAAAPQQPVQAKALKGEK